MTDLDGTESKAVVARISPNGADDKVTDSKLVTGVLIAACVCLLVANAMTWAGIIGYGKCEKEAAGLVVPARTRAPEPVAPAAPPAAQPEEAAPAQSGAAPEEGAVPE